MFATPANLPATSDPFSTWSAAPASARDTILLVEDQDSIAGLLTCIVERDGYRVLRASTGTEAVQIFAERAAQIALVLMDCSLPDLSGVSLSKQFREQAPGMPVLFVSGRDLSKLRDSLALGGPTGFLPKPFFPTEVLRQVRSLIGASV